MCGKARKGNWEEGERVWGRRPLRSVAPGRPLSRSGRRDKGRTESGGGRLTLSSAGTGESGNEGKGIARGGSTRGKAR